MKRVKLFLPMTDATGHYEPGAEIDVDDEKARQLVDAHHAAPVGWSPVLAISDVDSRVNARSALPPSVAQRATGLPSDAEIAAVTRDKGN